MSDERLRGAAREARESGDPAAEVRLLRERLRAGEVGEGIELLAGLGHAPAREVLGLEPASPLEAEPWVEALAGLPPELRARAAAALPWEKPIECHDRFDGPDDAFLAALDALDRCLAEPGSVERQERLAAAIAAGMQSAWGWSAHSALAAMDSIRALLAEPFSAKEHLARVREALEHRLSLERMQELALAALSDQLLQKRDPVQARLARLGRWLARVPGIVRDLAVSPDGTRLLVAHRGEGRATLLSLPDGAALRPVPHEGAQEVWAAAALPAGWLSGDSAGNLRRFDPAGEPVWTLEAHDEVRTLVAFADGARALTGGGEGALALWDLVAARELWRATAHSRAVNALAVSPDAKVAASADGEGRLLRWDLLRRPDGPGAEAALGCSVGGLAFLDDHHLVVLGDRLLAVWDVLAWQPIRRLEPAPSSAYALAVAPPHALVLGGRDGVQVWDLERGALLREGVSHAVPLAATFLSGNTFLSGSRSGAIRAWSF